MSRSQVPAAILAAMVAIVVLEWGREFFVPVALSIVVSLALSPVVRWMQRWWIPRAIGAAVVLLGISAVLVLLSYALRDDAADLLERVPIAVDRLRDYLQRLPLPLPSIDVPEYFLWGTRSAATVVGQIVAMLFLAYFLLMSGELFQRKLARLAAPGNDVLALEIVDEIREQIEWFLFMTLVRIVVVAAAVWGALWALGVEDAAVWGIVAGALDIVPYVGPAIAVILVAFAALLQFGGLGMGVLAGGAVLVIGTFADYLLAPWLMGRIARMNEVAVLLGLLFWGWVWGVWGVLLAVPLMMIIKVIADRVPRLRPLGELLGHE